MNATSLHKMLTFKSPYSVLLLSLLGLAIVLFGIAVEVHGQSLLMANGGYDAIGTYLEMVHAREYSQFEFICAAFQGQLPSFGGTYQGIGLAIMYAGPILAGLVFGCENTAQLFDHHNPETAPQSAGR